MATEEWGVRGRSDGWFMEMQSRRLRSRSRTCGQANILRRRWDRKRVKRRDQDSAGEPCRPVCGAGVGISSAKVKAGG
jgi:hypothetical protein